MNAVFESCGLRTSGWGWPDLRVTVPGIFGWAAPGPTDEIFDVISGLKAPTAEIERATTTSSPEMQKLIARSGEAVDKADRLISDVRKIWFMKMFLPRPKPQAEP